MVLMARNNAFGLMFQSLGHLAHHMQDMGQPQHARVEAHYPGIPPSSFEKRTAAQLNPVLASQLAVWQSYAIPSLPRVEDYWDSATPSFIGMAEFTGKNFVSFNTGFTGVANSNSLVATPNPSFPLPNGINPDGSRWTLQTQVRTLFSESTQQYYTVAANYVIATVRDSFGQDRPGVRIAVESMLERLSMNSSTRSFNFDDDQVWSDAYAILLPRATAFSAGLINHFFRGRLTLSRVAGTTWNISNPTTYLLDGNFTIFSEDSAGSRAPLTGPIAATISAGTSATLSIPEPPSGTTKLIAVFSGAVGGEGGRSAGVVIGYTPPGPPPVSCGTPVSAKGGTTGLTQVMDMGTKAGLVTAEFEAYSIPDALTINSQNSAKTELANTHGLVGGSHNFPFDFDATRLGNRFIDIKVTGNSDPSTAWTLTVSCPGKSLPPVYPLVNVTFGVVGSAVTCSSMINTYVIDGTQSVTISRTQPRALTLASGPHSFSFTGQTLNGCSNYGHPGFTDGTGSHDLYIGVGASGGFLVCPAGGCSTGIPTTPW